MGPHETFWHWVNERHAIYCRRFQARLPGPWTDDPILAQYSFCNVFRELDRVTIWVRENIRERFSNHPDLWIMLAIARTINWPDTLAGLINSADDCACWPSNPNWTPKDMGDWLDHAKGRGNKIYTGAYMIRAESDRARPWFTWTKQQYVAQIVCGAPWSKRDGFARLFLTDNTVDPSRYQQPTLQEVHAWLTSFHGWGPFMAYQVVVDLRWTHYLRNAPDIQTWSALGPGSRRGLNRLNGRPVDFNLSQRDGLPEMLRLHAEQDTYRGAHVPPIDLSDIQNCLCEFDKYSRVKHGEGRPRALFKPGNFTIPEALDALKV